MNKIRSVRLALVSSVLALLAGTSGCSDEPQPAPQGKMSGGAMDSGKMGGMDSGKMGGMDSGKMGGMDSGKMKGAMDSGKMEPSKK